MNINQLMKQAQQMQKKMQEMQEDIAKQLFEGKAGGSLVTITMTGTGEMKKVTIDPSLLKEECEILEDLILAAYNDAKSKADEASKDGMSGAFGGMMPPGFKLPF
jgi:DNA-binding YbaB/EbfC family protein